jgi:hypothetical protein
MRSACLKSINLGPRSVQPKEKCVDGCAFVCNREYGLGLLIVKIEILLFLGSTVK